MENTKTYAFTQENWVGRACPPVRTPLLQGFNPHGSAVVWLCQPDTFLPMDKGPALVVRADARSAWRALPSLEELESWLRQVQREHLANLLGVWVDRPKWNLFGAPDGKIQDKEVETFGQRWQGLRSDEMTQFEDQGYRSADPDQPPQRCIVGWWHLVGEVDPQDVQLLPAAYPDKRVAVLEEARKITRHEVISALRLEFDRGRSALVPTVTDHATHNPQGSQRKANLKLEECLLRGQREGNPSYVLPL